MLLTTCFWNWCDKVLCPALSDTYMPVLQKQKHCLLGFIGCFPGLNLSIDAAQELHYSVTGFLVFQLDPLILGCDADIG